MGRPFRLAGFSRAILGWLAAIGGAVDLFSRRYDNGPAFAWLYAAGNLVALAVATLNMFVHTRDAWTSVVPWGLALTAVTVIALVPTIWIGWAALYRRNTQVTT